METDNPLEKTANTGNTVVGGGIRPTSVQTKHLIFAAGIKSHSEA
jgi:hypothetical protein